MFVPDEHCKLDTGVMLDSSAWEVAAGSSVNPGVLINYTCTATVEVHKDQMSKGKTG